MAEKIKIPRRPLAWGMQVWGPMPGAERIYLLWGGPGDRIYVHVGDPSVPGSMPGRQVEHPSANGTYEKLRDAQAAVDAFVAIGIASWSHG